MQPKYSPGQTGYLSGANADLIEEAVVLKCSGGFYTIRFTKRKGGTRVREGRLCATSSGTRKRRSSLRTGWTSRPCRHAWDTPTRALR